MPCADDIEAIIYSLRAGAQPHVLSRAPARHHRAAPLDLSRFLASRASILAICVFSASPLARQASRKTVTFSSLSR